MAMPDPRAALFRLINGFQVTQAIYAAAALGLADLLIARPRTAHDLALNTHTNPFALYRLMRALASIGVFRENENEMFALAPLGEFLRSDTVGTYAPVARLFGSPQNWNAWGALLNSVQNGITAFDSIHSCGVWAYREIHPSEARVFDEAMAAGTAWYAAAVLKACDFGSFAHVIDVGGGDGMFLAKILATQPSTRGTLFDKGDVISRATASLQLLGLENRCEVCAGDFFVSVPSGGDAYLLKWILHDWDDTDCVTLLKTIRRAMTTASRLIVVEHVVGPPNCGPEGKFLDLMMMVMTGGRERTGHEFDELFSAAGFRLAAVTPTASELSVIEGVPQ